MANFFILENQISQVDSVIISIDNLLGLVKDVDQFDDKIYSTIGEIIKFIHKVMKMMPDILISEANSPDIKQNVIDSYEKVVVAWENIGNSRQQFFGAWENFKEQWKSFFSSLTQLKKEGHTIYLSMN